MYIRKKTFVLMLTYLLAALIALGVYTAAHFSLESGYRRTARQGYELAFEETLLSADRLAQELHRACYAAGGAYSAAVCADIYASSLSEIMTVAALPFSTQELERTAEQRFLPATSQDPSWMPRKPCGWPSWLCESTQHSRHSGK